MARLIHWAPRVTAILGIAFVSMFALDVFAPGVPPAEVLLGLLVHLIPSFVLAAILAFAWRFELLGGLAFLVAAAAPFVGLRNPPGVNLILAAPFITAGLLFVLSHAIRGRARRADRED